MASVELEPGAVDLEGLDEAQAAAVSQLHAVLGLFGTTLIGCRDAGLEPVDAFERCGVQIPAMMRPLANRILSST